MPRWARFNLTLLRSTIIINLLRTASSSNPTQSRSSNNHWKRISDAEPDDAIKFTIGLSLNVDHDEMHRVFSTFRKSGVRKSPRLLDQSLVRKRALAHLSDKTCHDDLLSFIKEGQNEIVQESKYGDYFVISGTVQTVQHIFKKDSISFGKYQSDNDSFATSGEPITRAEKMNHHAQSDIVHLLDWEDATICVGYIDGLINFPLMGRYTVSYTTPTKDETQKSNQSIRNLETTKNVQLPSGCKSVKNLGSLENTITPIVLMDMYSVPDFNSTPSTIPMGMFEFQQAEQSGEGTVNLAVSPDDLACMQANFGVSNPLVYKTPSPVISDCSAQDKSVSCLEPNLDVQYVAMNANAPLWYGQFQTYHDLFNALDEAKELPVVVSISYGQTFSENSQDESYVESLCKRFGMFSQSGVTFFAAAGDTGAALSPQTNDCQYAPSFPASCPYVTAVGGTSGFAKGTEVVCNSGITSGGGFSYQFTEEKGWNVTFQRAAVDRWLSSEAAELSFPGYQAKGRAYPDISAAARNYLVWIGGEIVYMDGTSAATPVMASLLARAAQITNNPKGYGWINPILYNAPAGTFFDVISGENNCNAEASGTPCCTDSSTGQITGFKATEGWDPASGVGTLGIDNGFGKFVDLFANMNVTYEEPTSGAFLKKPLLVFVSFFFIFLYYLT